MTGDECKREREGHLGMRQFNYFLKLPSMEIYHRFELCLLLDSQSLFFF